MAKKRKKKNKAVPQPQVKHEEAPANKSNDFKWLIAALAVILPICALAINWAFNLDLSSKDSLSVLSTSSPVTANESPAPDVSKLQEKYEVSNAIPYRSDYPLKEAEYKQLVGYVEKSLPEAKTLRDETDLIKALSVIENLPYDKLKEWFDKLVEEIRLSRFDGVYYDQLHEMKKLGAISQYLKDNVMKYDQNKLTSGQLISEIIETGVGACASMPILYAIVCQHMGLDMKIATVGDHVIARYQKDRTWVNIEMTVKDKTGVGVPDQRYFDGIINEKQLYQLATERGWDMTSLENSQIMGLMYSNKASHLFMKAGFRDGNLDALYDAASLGMYFYPNDWMLAENWRRINQHLDYRKDKENLGKLNEEIAKLEGKNNDPFSIGSIKIPKAKDPLAWEDKHHLSIAQNYEGKRKNLKDRINAIKVGAQPIEETKTMNELMDELMALNPGTYGFEKKDNKLQKLKQEQFYLQEKINRQNRKSEALKMMYQTGSTIRRKNTK